MGLVLVAAALLVGGLLAVQAAANSPATRSATSPASRVFPRATRARHRYRPPLAQQPGDLRYGPRPAHETSQRRRKPGYDPGRGTRRRPTRTITIAAVRQWAARPRRLRPRLG